MVYVNCLIVHTAAPVHTGLSAQLVCMQKKAVDRVRARVHSTAMHWLYFQPSDIWHALEYAGCVKLFSHSYIFMVVGIQEDITCAMTDPSWSHPGS